MPVFLQKGCTRIRVSALTSDFLSESLVYGCTMDPALMLPLEVPECRWLGYGIGKGVTCPEMDVTVFGVPQTMRSGLHGTLIQGFPDVDPYDLCYEDQHVKGFGGFIRWIYFSNPSKGPGVLGIEFSLHPSIRVTSGIATSFKRAQHVVSVCCRHGIPAKAEVALLNWRNCQRPHLVAFGKQQRLVTVSDWAQSADRFSTTLCWRCGKPSSSNFHYCPYCGAEVCHDEAVS